MNMSTGSTSQKDLLHNGFPLVIKPLDYVESEEIKKLIFAFEDDRTLRNFFITLTLLFHREYSSYFCIFYLILIL